MTRDTLIAEKIMNLIPCDQWERSYGGWGMAMVGEDLWMSHCGHKNCYNVKRPQKYGENLTLAWQAADRMCDTYGCAIKVERVLGAWEIHTKERYVASVNGGRIAYASFDCTAYDGSNEGPADALCQVMLKALEGALSEKEMRDL